MLDIIHAELLKANLGTFDWSSIYIPFHYITISLNRIVGSSSRVNLIKGDLYVLILGQLVDEIGVTLRVNLCLPLGHDSNLYVDALYYSIVRHVVVEAKFLVQILFNL